MDYFILVNGQNQGPYNVETLRSMGITPDTYVWTQGMEQWAPAGQIPELQSIFGNAQQPGQPPYQPPYQYMGGGAGFTEFITDEYEDEQDIPAIKRPLNKLLGWIDSGIFFREPLRWLYLLNGVLCIIAAIVIFAGLIKTDAFKYAFGYSLIVTILAIVFAIFGLLFWINRGKRVKEQIEAHDDFVAIPLVAHFIQSSAEFWGLTIGGMLAIVAFIIPLIESDSYREISRWLPFAPDSPLVMSLVGLVTFLLYGFFIILFGRLFAESLRALAAIANNTKKVVKNTEKNEE